MGELRPERVRNGCRRAVLSEKDIRDRVAEEAERALRYQRPLALFAVKLSGADSPTSAAYQEAICSVRSPDIVGRIGSEGFLFVLPETDAAASVPAERVLRALLRADGAARGGLVRCPQNGLEPETLVAAAVAAAEGASPGTFETPEPSVERFFFGETAPLVIAADEKTKRLFALIRNLARSDLPILLLGETGVGKEAAAAAVHWGSPWQKGPFVALNCAAVPLSLLESELFGHEKGAFSGALTDKPGLMEAADGGTLFLDEISEAPPEIQAKLLRVLETRRVRRVGAVKERAVSFRLVSAANRALSARPGEGVFRTDLYYRIGGARIEIAPLRERPGDILPMALEFLRHEAAGQGQPARFFSEAVEARLLAYDWPGNVRELKHVAAYAAATARGESVGLRDLPGILPKGVSAPRGRREGAAVSVGADPPVFPRIADEIRALEIRRMTEALTAAEGGRVQAAALIGMPLRTFVSKVKRYGLQDVGRRRASNRTQGESS